MAINVNINVSNLGAAVLSQNNPAAQSWIRVETNGAITLRTAAETLSDLGAQAAGAYVTAVTASGNIASSGGTTPNITFTGVLPTANGGTAVNIATTALTLGTASSAAGQLTLSNATNAFTQTIRGTNPAASIIYDLPTTAPTLGQVLSATAPAAGVVTLSWATAASGITVGTTTITSGTTGSIGMNIGGIYSESISYRAQQATPFSTAIGFESHSSGSFSGVHNTSNGYQSGKFITTGAYNSAYGSQSSQVTTGSYNSFFGHQAGYSANVTGSQNTGIGTYSCYGLNSGQYNVAIGYQSLAQTNATGTTAVGYDAGRLSGSSYSIFIGYTAGSTTSSNSSIIIGYGATSTTAANQGILGSNNANGYISNWYFNGVTHTAPYSVTLNASGASGSNVAGCTYTHAGSKGTGSGTPGTLVFKTSTTLGSGTTLQSLVSRLTISGGAVTTDASTATWADALDFVFGTTTGTKIGTGTTQKIGFWNATPLAQQTTASAASTFVANTSLIANDTATFDGYTLGQVVKILRNLGILA